MRRRRLRPCTGGRCDDGAGRRVVGAPPSMTLTRSVDRRASARTRSACSLQIPCEMTGVSRGSFSPSIAGRPCSSHHAQTTTMGKPPTVTLPHTRRSRPLSDSESGDFRHGSVVPLTDCSGWPSMKTSLIPALPLGVASGRRPSRSRWFASGPSAPLRLDPRSAVLAIIVFLDADVSKARTSRTSRSWARLAGPSRKGDSTRPTPVKPRRSGSMARRTRGSRTEPPECRLRNDSRGQPRRCRRGVPSETRVSARRRIARPLRRSLNYGRLDADLRFDSYLRP